MTKHKWLTGIMSVALACSITMAQPILALAETIPSAEPIVAQTGLISSNPTDAPMQSFDRIAGQDRYETAAKISEQGWTTSSDNAILAAGMDNNLVDALTAAPLAKALKAPILLTQGDSLNSYAKAELKRLGVKTVYVTSGPGVIKPAVTDELKGQGITVNSLGGSDRFATAVNIAQTLGTITPFTQVVVANAYSNADALSVAGTAAAQGMPILLTGAGALDEATSSYLNSLSGITKSYVVGGTGVISTAAQNALPDATRAGGANRFETNLQILKEFAPFLSYGHIYIANGGDAHLVDALAVAPLAAQTSSPVVMSDVQIPQTTLSFIKSDLLPESITVLGGESVVAPSSLSSLTSPLIYNVENDTQGSADPDNKTALTDSAIIAADNVTLQNMTAPYSIYIKGNTATLTNLDVKGTVFVDPGPDGDATLNNVHAAKIVVMSGAANTITLNDVTSDSLILNSSSNTRVESTGSTSVGGTFVASSGTLTVTSGSLGPVIVQMTPLTAGQINMQGTFLQPVTIGSPVPVVLSGSFPSVIVNAPANVSLGGNTTVTNMAVNSPATVMVPPTASIPNLTNSGNASTYGGGSVNGQTTSVTPPTPTPTPTPTPPSTTPVISGGGGGGGGYVPPVTPSTAIVSFALKDNNNTTVATGAGGSASVNLSEMSDDQRVASLVITATPANSTLQLNSLSSPITQTVLFNNKSFSVAGPITMQSLLGNSIQGGDVSVGSLRTVFGSTVTFNGTLSADNYTSVNVSLTMNLGGSSALNNQWVNMTISGNTVTATIKPGAGTTKLSSMQISSLLPANAGVIPISVSTNINGPWYNSNNIDEKESFKADIVSLAGGTDWADITLSQLAGKSVYFKDQNGSVWTINFRQ